MPISRVTILRPRFALASVLMCCLLSTLAFLSWIFEIQILRTLLPGFPGMIPTTALATALLGIALLLALAPQQSAALSKGRERLAFVLSVLLAIVTAGTTIGHIFSVGTFFNLNFIFESVPYASGILAGGNMSIQSSLAGLFLSLAVLLHLLLTHIEARVSRRTAEHMVSIIQILPVLTLGICCLAAIGYLQNIWRYFGATKYVGLSLPTMISFFALSLTALQLRRDRGYVALLISNGSAGLFIRRFIRFSIFGPLIITTAISWGEANTLYPDSFSLGLFVLFTIGALTVTSFITATAIQGIEDQRIQYETAKGRVALQETEETLRETKDRLQFALDASGMGTWELDLSGTKRVRWSNTTEILFGLAPGTFSGQQDEVDALIDPQDIEAVKEAQAQAIAEHRDLDFEFRCIRPDGLTRWLKVKGRANYDAMGTATKISGTILDVTREKFHQKTTEDALQAAQSANDLKSNFLASMSHEIRTPLGAILGFTELLRDPNVTPAEQEEYLKVITRNGETLSQLINDILDLSKVEAGHMNIENIRFSLATAVEEVATLLRNRAEKKGIELAIVFNGPLPTHINSDPIRLKQILFNLVGNALKFTPEGKVSIEVSGSHRQIIFDVRDTGIGIKPEQREFLFHPFIQADGSITRRFGGTGLGLSLSRNLASLLGGNVELLESQLGRGSTFRASIENRDENDAQQAEKTRDSKPQSDQEEQAGNSHESSREALKDVEILVVDDSLDNQNLIENILKKRGARMQFADNGLQAIQKVADFAFDVVLMDIQMPVMDGFAATKEIRKNGYQGPIIALTAHAMKDTRADCMQYGCSAFLPKPIDSQKLVATIRQLLPS